MKCIICKKELKDISHNAEPIAEGRCCNFCHKQVIVARFGHKPWAEIVLNKVYQTSGINNAIELDYKFAKEIMIALGKYTKMDWGITYAPDKVKNDNAVFFGGERVIAKYQTSKDNIFIITEADRSATTIMFTQEY